MSIVDVNFVRDPTTGAVLPDANGYPQIVADASANTYAQLQSRIQNEVLGSPTTSDIQNAISDAIAQYERESFWFNDLRFYGGSTGALAHLQTVAGKEFYSSQDMPALTTMPHIRSVVILVGGNRRILQERTPEWMDYSSMSPTMRGLPDTYCLSGGAMRLYPIPNGVYSLVLDGTTRFAPLVGPGDFNPWTNRAERLIRAEAKRLLFKDIIRDAEQAQAMELEIMGDPRTGRQGALAMLRRESGRRAGGGPIRSRFY